MNERRFVRAGSLALVLALLAVSSARAVIERPYPLEKAVKDGEFIFVATVDKLDPDKPSVVLTAGDALKGKVPFTRLPINLTGDEDARKKKEAPQLLKRLAPKLPLVLFVARQDKQYLALAYTNGTWFQLTADGGDKAPVWSFTHVEPYLRRTYKGTTEEMRQAVADAISGKKAPPKYDPKEKPGLGPEVEEKKGEEKKPASPPVATGGLAEGPPFAVIPSVAIGGILSLLAMLFPAVFGGLTGQMKRWMAVISVASLNTTLLWGYKAAADWHWLPESWRVTDLTLWLTLIVITVLGVAWAWRRQLRELGRAGGVSPLIPRDLVSDESGGLRPPLADTVPSRYEVLLLAILSGVGVVLFAFCLAWNHFHSAAADRYPLLALPWGFVLALWVGIWVGTLYALLMRWRAGRGRVGPVLSSEGVILCAMVPACLALGCAAAPAPPVVPAGGDGGGAVQAGAGPRGAKFLGESVLWTAGAAGGQIGGKPLIDGDRIYTAAALAGALNTWTGKVCCVERSTGDLLWEFSDGGKMKEVFSSPCVAGGKLYVGEGYHSDSNCKLYCLDAATGQKLWARPTESHTESSPCVAGGKVYCGAGGDGLLCLDAATGDKVWDYTGKHIDCPPVVVGQRVYCGSGIDRDLGAEPDKQPETAIFCLDADTGQELWKVTTDLPAWGKPFVAADQAFFPLGNGDAEKPAEKPAGALLCVSPADGKQLWRCDVGDGVLEGPAVDREQVYFGSRDGHCYCAGRANGKLRWKRDMGSPVIAAPALAPCSCCGATTSVYAVARGDPDAQVPPRVACLDPATGEPLWQHTRFPGGELISSPVVTVERTPDGDRRFVYFGGDLYGRARVVLYCLKDQWKEE